MREDQCLQDKHLRKLYKMGYTHVLPGEAVIQAHRWSFGKSELRG